VKRFLSEMNIASLGWAFTHLMRKGNGKRRDIPQASGITFNFFSGVTYTF